MRSYYVMLTIIISLLTPTQSIAFEKFPFKEEGTLHLTIGSVETFRSQDVERIAVGNEDIISVNILNTEEVLIIPLISGVSDVVLWHKGNRKTMIHIVVNEIKPLLMKNRILSIIKDRPELSLSTKNDQLLLSGTLANAAQREQIEEQLTKAGLISSIDLQIMISRTESLTSIQTMLSHIEGITINQNGENILIKGSFDPIYINHINDVVNRFPEAINLALENPAPERKMIEIAVQILEIKQRNLERIGIRWQEILSGPSLSMAQQPTANPYFSAISKISTSADIVKNIPLNDTHFYGAIGMATQIQSQIELLMETGAAKILAKPMLSTTENASATFHSGGQLPFPVLSSSGELTVEYQPYGIQLSVLPVVGKDENILVNFSAEVSSIDNAISVNGVPGLAVRQVTSVANTREGQTIMISGLVSKEENSSISKLPVLGDLPILGRFFRSRTKDLGQLELIIMLTPTIKSSRSPLQKFGEKVQLEFGQ